MINLAKYDNDEAQPAPVIVERSAPGIEVELIGGRLNRVCPSIPPSETNSEGESHSHEPGKHKLDS